MIMLDLQKAFDTVYHEILCKKLKGIGIRNIDWFKSYLSNRKQYAQLENVISDPGYVNWGVSQGNILGPLLFLIYYVNDIAFNIEPNCKLTS